MVSTEKESVSDHPAQAFSPALFAHRTTCWKGMPASLEESPQLIERHKISLNHGALELHVVGSPWSPQRQGLTSCRGQKDFARAR